MVKGKIYVYMFMLIMIGMIQISGCGKKEDTIVTSESVSNEVPTPQSDAKQENWIEDTTYFLLRSAGMDMEKEYYVSQAFSVYRESESDDAIYFVFCDGICVGELWVNEKEEGNALYQMNCEEITNLYAKGIEICVVSPDKDHLYVTRSDDNEVIYIYGIPKEDINTDLKASTFSTIVLSPLAAGE